MLIVFSFVSSKDEVSPEKKFVEQFCLNMLGTAINRKINEVLKTNITIAITVPKTSYVPEKITCSFFEIDSYSTETQDLIAEIVRECFGKISEQLYCPTPISWTSRFISLLK